MGSLTLRITTLLDVTWHVGGGRAIGNARRKRYILGMERFEVPVSGETERWVEAVERGDEVVLTRAGKVVAEVVSTASGRIGLYDPKAIRRLHAAVPDALRGQGAEMIRELRDEYRY